MPRPKKQHLKQRTDGRYCCKYKGIQFFGRTEDEALKARDEYKAAHPPEIIPPKVLKGQQTFSEYAEWWLPVYKAGVRGNTYQSYKSLITRNFVPIEDIRLADITPDDIAVCYSRLVGKSASYIAKVRILLTEILNSAVDSGYITKNPALARSVRPPKGPSGTHRAITEFERNIILSTPHRMQLPALLMLYAGIRRGELLALRSENIKNGYIYIHRAVSFTGNTPVLSPPKNDASIRKVPLLSFLNPYLQNINGYVCPSASGSLMTETAFKRAWQSYMHALSTAAKTKISIRPHDLRHSYCTMLRDSGVDIHQAILWMGHTDEKMILAIYDHPGQNREEDCKTRLETLTSGMQIGMQSA